MEIVDEGEKEKRRVYIERVEKITYMSNYEKVDKNVNR